MSATMPPQPSLLEDVLDAIQAPDAVRPLQAVVPPVGPRTLGNEDERWTREIEEITDVQRIVEDHQIKRVTPADVTDFMVSIVAKADDPTIAFSEARREVALAWITRTLKPAFQSVRVPNKKPWPEFLASLMDPRALSRSDADIMHTLFGVAVGHPGEAGELVIPQALLDADFGSDAIDARTGSDTSLGLLVAEAWERYLASRPQPSGADRPRRGGAEVSTVANTSIGELRASAAALAVRDTRDPKATLACKIAARKAALYASVVTLEARSQTDIKPAVDTGLDRGVP